MKSEALAEREQAIGSADEAERLKRATERAKEERKAS